MVPWLIPCFTEQLLGAAAGSQSALDLYWASMKAVAAEPPVQHIKDPDVMALANCNEAPQVMGELLAAIETLLKVV